LSLQCAQIILVVALCALPLLTAGTLDSGDNTTISTPIPDLDDSPNKAEQQYSKAVEIRDAKNPSAKDLKRAVDLLYAAANIEHLSIDPDALHHQEQEQTDAAPSHITAASIKLTFRNNTVGKEAALKELIYVFREGDGAPFNPAIAHRLLQELAAVGDPEAQADVGFYLALGIEPVAPNPQDQLFRIVPPDLPAALLHYYFASKAGDGVAQMALGYRHLFGLGVPKSCQTALLYYEPVASTVVAAAQAQEGLPQIRPFRLSHRTAHARPRPSLEQEVRGLCGWGNRHCLKYYN
jgi:TPR repeat protein